MQMVCIECPCSVLSHKCIMLIERKLKYFVSKTVSAVVISMDTCDTGIHEHVFNCLLDMTICIWTATGDGTQKINYIQTSMERSIYHIYSMTRGVMRDVHNLYCTLDIKLKSFLYSSNSALHYSKSAHVPERHVRKRGKSVPL